MLTSVADSVCPIFPRLRTPRSNAQCFARTYTPSRRRRFETTGVSDNARTKVYPAPMRANATRNCFVLKRSGGVMSETLVPVFDNASVLHVEPARSALGKGSFMRDHDDREALGAHEVFEDAQNGSDNEIDDRVLLLEKRKKVLIRLLPGLRVISEDFFEK